MDSKEYTDNRCESQEQNKLRCPIVSVPLPRIFPPHSHSIDEVTDLSEFLDFLLKREYAPLNHTHDNYSLINHEHTNYASVEHIHSYMDMTDTSFQDIVLNDSTAIPMVIQLDSNKPIVMFNELTSTQWNISVECDNMKKDGVFTWELMFLAQHDITSISYDSDITYVGEDKDDVIDKLKLIDGQPTYHVFAFRILSVGSMNYKTINYCYSFKK